jgi:RNA polymerase sigma factor (sigma-70 family)
MDPSVSSFGSLYTDLYSVVSRVVRVTLGADSEQEDVLQNAIFQVYRHLGNLRDPAKFKSWAAAIAVHTVRRELRRRQRQRWLMSVDLSESSPLLSYEPDFERGFRQERARRVLTSLPPPERDVLTLWLAGSGTITEIARDLGCSLSTARRRLRRARRALGRAGG